MEFHPPAGHPAPVRAGTDRQALRRTAEAAGQAAQAQGRRRRHQRLRRGPRGRADLPLHHPVFRGEEAHPAPVAAVHDTGRHPRRLRQPARRRGHEAAGSRRPLPRRGRLAGGHQRHPRHDGLQQQGRRLLQDPGGPRPDAHPGDRDGARGPHPRLRVARLLGSPRHLRRRRRPLRGPLVRPGLQEERTGHRGPRFAPVVRIRRPYHRGRLPRAARQRDRGIQAQHADVPGPVRPDHPAARGQLALRLFRQDHAVPGPVAVRAPQGPDLPAYGFPLPAPGLRRHRAADHARPGRQRIGRGRTGSSPTGASSTTRRSPTTSPSSPPCRCRAN